METHLLIVSNSFLSKKVLDKFALLMPEFSDINKKYNKNKLWAFIIYDEEDTKKFMEQINYHFKSGVLLCLDVQNLSCVVYKYYGDTDLKKIDEIMTPTITHTYETMTYKPLGKFTFVDYRYPKGINHLFENFCEN